MAIETGKYVKRFAFWNPATWAIPKLYWDAFSQEQRIHAICRQLEKVIRYADYVGVNVDDIAQRLQDIEDGKLDDIIVSAVETWFEEHESDILQRLDIVEATIGDGFSPENTISNVVSKLESNIETTIGDGFSPENTISNAFSELINDVEMLEQNESEIYGKLKYITSKDFKISNRFMIGSSVHDDPPFYGYGGTQGSCVVNIGGIDYWICLTNPDNNNWMVITEVSTNRIVATPRLPLGHGNTCSYDGEHTLVVANEIDKTIVYVDISDIETPFVRNTVPTPGGETIVSACYIGNTGKVMLVHGLLTGAYNFNVTGATVYTDETLTEIDSKIVFHYDSNQFSGWQSVTCDGTYIFISHSGPECIVVLDMRGNVFANINIENTIAFSQVDEIESAFVVGNKLYVSLFESLTATYEPERTDSTKVHMSSLATVDLLSNTVKNRMNPNYGWTVNNDQAGYYIYDPFETFEDDVQLYNRRLLNPSRYGFMFIDDVFAILNSYGLYSGQLILNYQTDYSLNTLISGKQLTMELNSHAIAGFQLTHSNVGLTNGSISSFMPRPDNLKYAIIAFQSTLHIPSGLTFPAGSTYDVQGNSAIILGSKPADSFTIFKYAGTIVSPIYE